MSDILTLAEVEEGERLAADEVWRDNGTGLRTRAPKCILDVWLRDNAPALLRAARMVATQAAAENKT